MDNDKLIIALKNNSFRKSIGLANIDKNTLDEEVKRLNYALDVSGIKLSAGKSRVILSAPTEKEFADITNTVAKKELIAQLMNDYDVYEYIKVKVRLDDEENAYTNPNDFKTVAGNISRRIKAFTLRNKEI